MKLRKIAFSCTAVNLPFTSLFLIDAINIKLFYKVSLKLEHYH